MESNPNLLLKQRVEYIDLLKAFGIFCVLWGHSIGDLRTSAFFLDDPVHTFISTFHMPLFFMISGFFFVSSLDLSFKDVLRRKFLYLIIPHITWSILITLMDWGMSFIGWKTAFSDKPFSIIAQIQAIFMPDVAIHLWFFKDLFVTMMITLITYKIFKKRPAAFVASMLFVLFFNLFGIVGRVQRFMMPIFWAGIMLKIYHPFFSKHINKFLIGSGILLLVSYCFYDYTYLIYLMDFPTLINFSQSLTEGKIIFDFTNIGVSVFRSLIGIAGSVFFFALFQRFWKNNAVTSFFSRCGRLTVGIYGIQSIVLQRAMHNLLDFAGVNVWVYRLLITPMTGAFVFFVSIGIIKLIQRNNALAFVLFGSSLIKHKKNHDVNSDNRAPQSI